MRSLFEAGILEERRAGAGTRVLVVDAEAVRAFADRHFPDGLDVELASDASRSEAVRGRRDAKLGTGTTEALLMRAMAPAVVELGNHSLDVHAATQSFGVAAVRLDETSQPRFAGRLALVENDDVFWHFEKTGLPADVACLMRGRISNRVLEWLSSEATSSCTVLHCGDYDPVGVDEYRRLVEAPIPRVVYACPGDLSALIERHGKRALVRDSAGLLPRLRRNDDPVIRRMLDLFDRFGAGVEQEILISTTHEGRWASTKELLSGE